MGRRIDSNRRQTVLDVIEQHDGQLKAGALAKLLGLHPQEIARVLTSLEDEPDKYLSEDDRGFLSMFKFW